jgi:hypothetical protein
MIETGEGERVGVVERNGREDVLFDFGMRLEMGSYAIPVLIAFPGQLVPPTVVRLEEGAA